jgi:outer membrane protein
MIRHTRLAVALVALASAQGAYAQAPLTLTEAVARARAEGAEARLSASTARAPDTRVTEARAGFLPRVDATESWTRGNQPVYVFGSLLNQRHFSEANFAIDALNRPNPITNHRASLTIQELLWDGGEREAQVQSATLSRDAARVEELRVRGASEVAAAEAFGAVLRFEAAERAARAAIAAAESDLGRARNRKDAGLVTDADVLAIDVRLSTVRAARAHAEAEAIAARARLNRSIGAPIDERFTLDPAPPAPSPETNLDAQWLAGHPDARAASIREALAKSATRQARAALAPRVAVVGGWEWNGGRFDDRAASWLVGAELRWSLFSGFADRARLARARIEASRAAIDRERTEASVAVEARAARARLEAARQTEEASRSAVASALESERIVRDRYQHGLADVTSLLRAGEAVVNADAQATSAKVDVLVRSVVLDRALGREGNR